MGRIGDDNVAADVKDVVRKQHSWAVAAADPGGWREAAVCGSGLPLPVDGRSEPQEQVSVKVKGEAMRHTLPSFEYKCVCVCV